jgi:hypothetical protein
MSIDLANYEAAARRAVRQFWQGRREAQERQIARGTLDTGSRGAVTAGKTLDGFIDLVRELVIANGLPPTALYNCREETAVARHNTLPGYYRPTKNWDLLVVSRGNLIAAIEFKSQVGSYGNNFNNRCEEAIGTATDLWTAFREGGFRDSPRPFLGYLMLLADGPDVRQPMNPKSSHFQVFPEFDGASYADRYDLFCRKLVREGLFTCATLMLSPEQEGSSSGAYSEVSDDTGLRRLVAGLASHVAGVAAMLE